ncbi:MAG: hypothetical protein QXU82_03130 [Candidatus Aenigmatarchaeota archaeon]
MARAAESDLIMDIAAYRRLFEKQAKERKKDKRAVGPYDKYISAYQ